MSYKEPERRYFRDGKGLDADNPWFGFYVKMAGEPREQLKKVRNAMRARYGGKTPSWGMVMDELMETWLKHNTKE